MKRPDLYTLAALGMIATAAFAAETQTTYFIGNSLTMSMTPDRVHALFAQRGVDLQFGSQLSGGKSLIRHKNYHAEPDAKWTSWETNVKAGDTFEPSTNHWADRKFRFGLYDQALTGHKWDRLVMQVYGSNLHDDLEAIGAFIDLARQHEATDTFYIYSTWPRRPAKRDENNKPLRNQRDNIDYAAAWTADYTAGPDDTDWKAGNNYASRDYINTLFEHLNKQHADLPKPIRLVPTGEVLFAIDRKIKADQLPGLKALAKRKPEMVPGLDDDTDFSHGVNVLYADAIHLNPIPHKGDTLGIFISGTTMYAVLSGQSPVGLSGKPYGLDDEQDAELIRAVQQTIWDVVTADPRTGVKSE